MSAIPCFYARAPMPHFHSLGRLLRNLLYSNAATHLFIQYGNHPVVVKLLASVGSRGSLDASQDS